MATVTGLTADRMLAIEAASVIDGDVVGDNLILTTHGGTQINAGSVRGPEGPIGPIGQDLSVVTQMPVLNVGTPGQLRAGRQLTAADFTNMGMSAPTGLWNLSDLTDASGNGRNLLNKGAVPVDVGINGLAGTAARFVGLASQALYIPDTGAADPFRIKTGTWGCWFRTAKRGVYSCPIGKWGLSAGTNSWLMQIASTNYCQMLISATGNDYGALAGVTDVCDDRWHFLVCTFDGMMMRLYVDGVLDATGGWGSPIFSGPGPLNIGANGADAATAGGNCVNGRIDEAFVTPHVLSEDQIRNLYCIRIPHTLATTPKRVSLNVHRLRRNATLVLADFATQPVRLYNFSGGSLGDEGSNGAGLTNNGGAVSTAGADGAPGNAFTFLPGQSLSATDTGLPTGTSPRSFGAWFKNTNFSGYPMIISWGGGSAGYMSLESDGRLKVVMPGMQTAVYGPFVGDGLWHHAVYVEENAPIDGLKGKLYLDGRLVGSSTEIGTITLGGANLFRVGAYATGTYNFLGQIDSVFVTNYALSGNDVYKLFAKGAQSLGVSPKNPGDHIERMDAAGLLATFDTLESQHLIDLSVT